MRVSFPVRIVAYSTESVSAECGEQVTYTKWNRTILKLGSDRFTKPSTSHPFRTQFLTPLIAAFINFSVKEA